MPTEITKPTTVVKPAANGTQPVPEQPKETKTEAKPENLPEVEKKAKRTRGPNKPTVIEPMAFAKALKTSTSLDALYQATGLERKKENFDAMRDLYRIFQEKGVKVPNIPEFAKQSRVKYDRDALGAILGLEEKPEDK